MIKLYEDVEARKVTNGQARTRTYIAKTMLDSLKVEIAAAALGKQFHALQLDNQPVMVEETKVA